MILTILLWVLVVPMFLFSLLIMFAIWGFKLQAYRDGIDLTWSKCTSMTYDMWDAMPFSLFFHHLVCMCTGRINVSKQRATKEQMKKMVENAKYKSSRYKRLK